MVGFGGLRSVRAGGLVACASLAVVGAAPALAAPAPAASALLARSSGPGASAPSGTPSPVGSVEAAESQPESSEPAPASLPPELVALERKMEGLQLHSVKVSFHETVSVSPSLTHGGRKHRLSTSHGVLEVGFRHHAARMRLTLHGRHARARLVHGILYLSTRSAARMDGGRPWVAIHRLKEPPEHLNLGPKLLDSGPTLALLRETLAGAVSVVEDGTATVEGRRALHFTATFTRPGHAAGGPGKGSVPPEKGRLQLFLTPAGRPIETIGTVDDGLFVSRAVSRLERVDFPVIVKPPPARLTISERALQRIERRRSNRITHHIQGCHKRARRAERRSHHQHRAQVRRRLRRCVAGRHAKHGEHSPHIVVVKG